LANRPDLNAMENVAREVGALLDRPVTIKDYSVKKKKIPSRLEARPRIARNSPLACERLKSRSVPEMAP
jgi:hypothetical protein